MGKEGEALVYENICRIAKKKGMSIRQVEMKAGLKGVIGRWKTLNPSMKNLIKVANALGVSPMTLMREPKADEKEEIVTSEQ